MTLEAIGLSAGDARQPVVRDVSLSVEPGEIVVVRGDNGSGKTTLLRAMTGLTPIRSGEVRLDDDVLDLSRPSLAAHAGIAHVAAARRPFGSLTVEQNLQVAVDAVRPGTIEAAAAAAYELFPILGERRGQRAALLSGGEQQMLSLARALVLRPRYLLLDEPSTGLARDLFGRLLAAVVGATGSGVGVLLVEQDRDDVAAVATRIHTMRAGRIVDDDPGSRPLMPRSTDRPR